VRAPDTSSVSLTLDTLPSLFVSTEVDPLRGRFDDRSGIEYLIDTVGPTDEPLEIDIRLTAHHEVPYTDAEVAAAITGYADVQLERLAAARERIRRLVFKELTFGVIFLASCLLLGSILAGFDVGPEWFRGFIVEGLVIVGWIALWHPVDMLFFERLPLIREQRILNRLKQADVRVRRADSRR